MASQISIACWFLLLVGAEDMAPILNGWRPVGKSPIAVIGVILSASGEVYKRSRTSYRSSWMSRAARGIDN